MLPRLGNYKKEIDALQVRRNIMDWFQAKKMNLFLQVPEVNIRKNKREQGSGKHRHVKKKRISRNSLVDPI